MMHMEHRLAQTQSQRLMLTQKMQQAIQILQLSALELEQHVQQELETNPVLEQAPEQIEPDAPKQATAATSSDGESFDDVSFDLDKYASQWNDGPLEGRDLSYNPDIGETRDYHQNSITKEESFTAVLLRQLHVAAPDERTYAIGERIIGDIDDRGYFTGSLEDIARELDVPLREVEAALGLIQTFEPAGVGARDLIECLHLQIDVEFPGQRQLKELVRNHLEALEHGQIPKIARAMKITSERVAELKAMLAQLNPWPGNEYASGAPQYIIPDVVVDKNEETGEYEVYLADGSAPKLQIDRTYAQMAKNGKASKEDREYLREKLESARWLIRNIEQRQQTILRIAMAIAEVQHDFFEKGPQAIKPLTLQEIADRVGVHEATVSRTTRGKYMQTPQGLYEMKYFFSPALRGDNGESQSSRSVQSMVKKLIEEEDKRKPLSDQKLSELLKEQGINCARRTVTKYREAMGILPTSMRRSYQKASNA